MASVSGREPGSWVIRLSASRKKNGLPPLSLKQAVHDRLVGLLAEDRHFAHVLSDVRSLKRDHGQRHVPDGGPFGHQVGKLTVVAELFFLDGGHRKDRDVLQLAEEVV
jgi:hypothetical protein